MHNVIQSNRIPKQVKYSIVIIIGIAAIYYGLEYLQTDRQTVTQPYFSYASPESVGLSNESINGLMEEVKTYVDDEMIVGAELVVIKDRKIILHECSGWRDKENEIPIERNTIFNIRSMTKPVTGAAIQILIDEGKLKLDDKASNFLPGFNNAKSGNITIEQLLSHRSGLPLSILTSTDEYESLLKLANAEGEVGPSFSPGTKFWYSDAGAEALGAIVEVLSGSSLDLFVTQRLLEPLNMNSSYYYHFGTLNDSRRDNIADLYLGGVGEWVKIWSPTEPLYPYALGSQGIYSTPLDYARFLGMLMDGGQVDGVQVLSVEAVERILTPVVEMSSLGSDMAYPEGFYNLKAYYGQMAILYSNSSDSKVEVFGHSGSDGTYAWVWPSRNLMILFFTQSRGGSIGINLEAKIDELLIHPEISELNDRAAEEYASYLGSYTANFGPFRNPEFTVTVQNGVLAVDIPNQLTFELVNDEPGKWHFKLMEEVSITFESEAEGVTAMMLNQSGAVFRLPKGEAPVEEIYPTDLDKYLGTYETEDPNITMNVVLHEGVLALDIPGQPTVLDLYPPDEQGLWYIRLSSSTAVSFTESEDGDITAINFHLPDGTTFTRKRLT